MCIVRNTIKFMAKPAGQGFKAQTIPQNFALNILKATITVAGRA